MKKNQKLLILLVGIFVCAAASVSVSAQIDLNTRKAIYFTGAKTTSIDLSKDIYVASGSTLHLSAELRTRCDKDVCEFNVGVIAIKAGTGSISTTISVDAHGETFTKSFIIGASETSKQVVFPVKLRLGKNDISVRIDPANQTPESNENNNSFSATVIVSWKRANPGNKN